MPKFFIENSQLKNEEIIINGNDVNHIKNVLRKQIGDKIEICNQDTMKNYMCEINNMDDDKIMCKIIREKESNTESNIKVTIFQGLPKADKMELIIQKSVELGAHEIVPVNMKRCVVKIEAKDEKKKIDRWQKISEVAAKQCGRDIVPEIRDIVRIKNICEEIKKIDFLLVAYENEKNNTLKGELLEIKNKIKDKEQEVKIGILIGPEGGIDEDEIKELKNIGAKIITLGNRILRTETVALNVLSVIMYELEN